MDAPSGQMHQSEYANLVLFLLRTPRSLLCGQGFGLAVATVLKMGAEPEAARIMRWLGPKKEAENGSHDAHVSSALPARLPSHPEQDWSRVSQWGILSSYAGTRVSMHK